MKLLGVFVPPPPPLDGMLVHRRVTPALNSPVPIYTPWWREERCGRKMSCPKTQRNVPRQLEMQMLYSALIAKMNVQIALKE